MNGADLKEVISTLPTYPEWSEGIVILAASNEENSRAISSGTRVEKAEAELQVAKLEEALALPHAQLRVEIAQAQKLLPLPYRVGALAVFNGPQKFTPSKRSAAARIVDIISSGNIPWESDHIKFADFHHPSSNPYEQSARIGNVLHDTAAGANKRRGTVIARLSTGRRRQNLSFPTDVEYCVVAKGQKGLDLKEPVINTEGEVPLVTSNIPYIHAKPGKFNPVKRKIVEADSRRGNPVLTIPAIAQLQGGRNAGKLLFGSKAHAFANLHFNEEAERRRKRDEKSEEVHPLDRRYA
jgi:hypothetical protein